VAKEIGVDHRKVAAAYRALEAEGLVEIRPGSGVYLARDASGASAQPEAERWVSEVLLEGWTRRIGRRDVGALVERCARAVVRCACVESNEDHLVALAAELEEDFSLDVRPVLVSPSAGAGEVPADALAAADLVATTVFHAAAACAAAERAGKPCIVLRLNPHFGAEVARVLSRGGITCVAVDPRFAARARAYLDVTPHREQVRFVLADELDGPGDPVDPRSGGVLLTRAARRRLGLPEFHLVPGHPYVCRESARELLAAVVRLGLGDRSGRESGG
jgi:hypothetical protein